MAEKAKSESQDPDGGEPKVPVDALVAGARGFLGVEPYVAAGGLHGIERDLTPSEAKARVKTWLNKSVRGDS